MTHTHGFCSTTRVVDYVVAQFGRQRLHVPPVASRCGYSAGGVEGTRVHSSVRAFVASALEAQTRLDDNG